MSRDVEKAYEAYPYTEENHLNHEWNAKRLGFQQGYHQAEKDLELSWEDISKIISIDQQVCGIMGISDYTHNHQQAMEEVLKRFRDYKK